LSLFSVGSAESKTAQSAITSQLSSPSSSASVSVSTSSSSSSLAEKPSKKDEFYKPAGAFSTCWETFSLSKNRPDSAYCHLCSSYFKYNKEGATSNLLRHASMCAKSKAKNSKSPSVVELLKTIPQKEMQQQQRFESDLLNLVVQHNLPLSFVDYPFFQEFFKHNCLSGLKLPGRYKFTELIEKKYMEGLLLCYLKLFYTAEKFIGSLWMRRR